MRPGATRVQAKTLVLFLVALCVAGPASSHAQGGLVVGGPLEYADSVSPEGVGAPRSVPQGRFYTGAAPMQFGFYPMGGILDRDVVINNFVDLEPTAGLRDWHCAGITYDGHDASDADIVSFGEQAIGVPIFAVADGTVGEAHDGEPDTSTCFGSGCSGQQANYVVLDHGNGVETRYFHMKTGSVAVQVGDTVRAGQQIGLIGSSGLSSGPHLHFATYYNGEVVEPWAGDCRSGASWWREQPALEEELKVTDFGVMHETFDAAPQLPYEMPREGQIALSDPTFSIWFVVENLPANSTWRFRFLRPNGTVAYEPTGAFNNAQALRRGWYGFTWDVADMHTITGTWRIQLDINGPNALYFPVEVRTARTSDFNRAPAEAHPAFRPALPAESDVIFCLAHEAPPFLDDPDFDIVRYEYVWRVNDQEVRRITSAALSDALPAGTAHTGDAVTCTVTPSDGKVSARSTQGQVHVGDSDGDGLFDQFELDSGLLPHDTDTDNDGLSDGAEAAYDGDPGTYSPYDPVDNPTGTDLNATRVDTDGDGLADRREIEAGLDPLDPADAPPMPAGSLPGLALLVAIVLGVAVGYRHALPRRRRAE